MSWPKSNRSIAPLSVGPSRQTRPNPSRALGAARRSPLLREGNTNNQPKDVAMPARIGLMLTLFGLAGCAGYYEPSPPPAPPPAMARSASPPAPDPKTEGTVKLEWTPPDDRT